jgi:type II secretory ATPase GspE/PulE/Tfp pilus assembly ATPase PilB-like protein
MGIPAFLLPASINAIIAQRLIRKLCEKCKRPVPMQNLDPHMRTRVERALKRTAKEELISRISPDVLQKPIFYEPVGCSECDNIGYK